jgi:DNA polymerase
MDGFSEVLRDTQALLKQMGRTNRGMVAVSPEVAALLGAIQSGPAPAPALFEETPPAAAPAAETGDRAAALAAIDAEVCDCHKCGLSATRTHTVFGSGNPDAQLVFVGEAPGADEDRQGKPFVGKAGQLLTDIIVKGMKLRREDVYICNVLKCRPPENRDPSPEEVYYCESYLLRQLEVLRPKAICALGRVAAQTLLKTSAPIGSLRGRWHNYHGIPFRVTYHPSYLLHIREAQKLRDEKRKVWDDVQEVMKVLQGEYTPEI